MKKFLSALILLTLLLSCISCGTLPWEKNKESASLPTDDFTLSVGETADGVFSCRGLSENAVVISSDESVAKVVSYSIGTGGSLTYKIIGQSAGEVTVSVKSAAEGITLDSHTYTVA